MMPTLNSIGIWKCPECGDVHLPEVINCECGYSRPYNLLEVTKDATPDEEKYEQNN